MATLLQPLVGGQPPPLTAREKVSKRSSRAALRSRQRCIRNARTVDHIPPHSPAMPSGLLNIRMSQMPGADALKQMGPLGNMMSSLGLGDEDDDEKTDTDASQQAANRPAPSLGRRQRRRVVRIGR